MLALMVACALAAEPSEAQLKEYVEQSKTAAVERVAELKQQIRFIQRPGKNELARLRAALGGRTKSAVIKELRDEIKAVESGEEVVWGPLKSVTEGEIGTLDRQTFIVRQVVDRDNVILDRVGTQSVVRETSSGQQYVRAVPTQGLFGWIKGHTTAGLADDRAVPRGFYSGVFHVTGSQTYPTSNGGTNTVLVLEPLDEAKLTPYLPKKPAK